MALINCPECNKEISDQGSNCPYCGYPLKKGSGKAVGKNKIIGAVCVAALVGVVVFLADSVLNNNEKKAISYYQKGELSEFKEMESKMKEDEVKQFAEYLQKEVDAIREEYIEEKIEYKEAKKRLQTLIKYSDKGHVANYNSVCEELKELNASRTAYKEAQAEEKSSDFKKAYDSYTKVIEEDKNYKNAQEKMSQMEEMLVEEYQKDAAEDAKNGHYADAIRKINKALEYIPDNQELEEKKAEYTLQKEKQMEKREEAERAEALLTEGKVIETNTLQATYIGAEITDSIKSDNGSGGGLYANG